MSCWSWTTNLWIQTYHTREIECCICGYSSTGLHDQGRWKLRWQSRWIQEVLRKCEGSYLNQSHRTNHSLPCSENIVSWEVQVQPVVVLKHDQLDLISEGSSMDSSSTSHNIGSCLSQSWHACISIHSTDKME